MNKTVPKAFYLLIILSVQAGVQIQYDGSVAKKVQHAALLLLISFRTPRCIYYLIVTTTVFVLYLSKDLVPLLAKLSLVHHVLNLSTLICLALANACKHIFLY
jgi:hypothetical protein